MLFRHHKVIHECIEGIFRGIDVHNICEGKLLFTRNFLLEIKWLYIILSEGRFTNHNPKV